MMRHQGTEHHIERLIGEGEMLDHPDLEIDGQVAPSSFRAGTGDLLCTRVNAEDVARCANALLDFNRQRSSAAAHIQHLLSELNAGQVGGPLPELPQLATEQEGVDEPCHQVVAPAPVEDQPMCLFGRRLARFAVVVMCERMHRSCSFHRKPLFCCEYTVCMNRGRSPPSRVWQLAPSEHPGWSTRRRREQAGDRAEPADVEGDMRGQGQLAEAGVSRWCRCSVAESVQWKSSRLRSVPCTRKSLHKLACELGGLGQQTDVAAGQLGQVQTELLAQFCAYLIAWITTRFPPGRQHDAISMRFERVKIEFDCRILTQLVLEPVGGIGQRVLVLGGTGHCLPV